MERLSRINASLTSSPSPILCSKTPVKVTITGAAGNIGYSLAFMIGGGRLLGPNQPIELTLLELPHAEQALQGVVMELKDAAFPLLTKITPSIDQNEGFKGCQIAILVGAKPRGKGMDRKDLLEQNGAIFKSQGVAIQNNAHKDVKVVVVGNPANTNAAILSEFGKSINPKNITSLTRYKSLLLLLDLIKIELNARLQTALTVQSQMSRT